MSLETNLCAALAAVCPRVFPDVADEGTGRPYITWQALGGATARYVEGAAADKRNTLMQINVWSTTRLEALALIRQVEDLLCASAAFVAMPEGEALSTFEPDTSLYGCIQRFSIWSPR